MASNRINGSTQLLNPHGIRLSPMYNHIAHASEPATVVAFAGQIGLRSDGTVVEDPEEQIRQALKNLSMCLAAAGARVSDIIKLTYYIVDFDHRNPRQRGPLREFLGNHRPPSTLVPVTQLALPGIVFEIDATAAIPHPTAEEKFDVIVVGAGLSGLQAATDLSAAGLKVKVLEARDRVGGKTYSVSAQGSICDVGAAWINDSNQSKVFELAKRLGLSLITQNTAGNVVFESEETGPISFAYGAGPEEEKHKEAFKGVVAIRELFESTCQKIDTSDPVSSGQKIRRDLDSIDFEEWLKSVGSSSLAVDAMKIATRALLGVEPSDISALYLLDYCKCSGGYVQMRSDSRHGGQYLRIAEGTQSLSKGLAKALPFDALSLMSPVRRIEQSNDGVRVFSARGRYLADRVIVSVPTPLYKEINFEPPLSQEKNSMVQSTRLGDYCKSILFYSSPWWVDAQLCGLAQSPRGPFAVTRDTSVENDGQYSLTCFVTGQPAREWMLKPRKIRDAEVLGAIERVFAPFAKVQEPIEIVEQIWAEEQWSQGCPCPVMSPGGLTNFEKVLRAPHGRVHFVGTEMAYEWKGYMDGALRSGEAGAKEVIATIGTVTS